MRAAWKRARQVGFGVMAVSAALLAILAPAEAIARACERRKAMRQLTQVNEDGDLS